MFDLILIIADKFDVHADTVQERFLRSGTKFFRLDLDTESLKTTYATFNENHWELETATGKLDTRSVTKVWLRRSSVEVSLEERQDRGVDTQIWCSEWNKTLSGIYLSLQNARWLNPLREGLRAENKYLQMETARSVGMKMPDTIVSNRKSELMAFADKYQYVALKLMSQDLFLDEEGTVKGIFVNRLSSSDLADFGLSSENPIVLQQYIEKLYEVRYTVVGTKHLVCKIESQQSSRASVDWRRYDIPRTPHSIIEPPEDISFQVNNLMKRLGLEFGALDFIVTETGVWYFLEVNPSGQWLWIEDLTGLPIADSIAYWLQTEI